MNILITGASGFIGQKLIHDMLKVKGLSLYALFRQEVSISEVTCFQANILDLERLDEIFRSNTFHYVIHLAAITEHAQIVDNRLEAFNLNLHGTMNLLTCFNKYCKGACFLYASTGKVYGKTNEMPISENALVNPQNILGKTKRITEEVIDFYAIPQNQYLICRIFNIYGEKQKRSFVVPTIIDQLDEPVIVLGNLKDIRDYLHIDDLSAALKACVFQSGQFKPVDYINIGSGEPACVADILREIGILIGKRLKVQISTQRLRQDETLVEFCNREKITSLTGWKPTLSLTEGLQQMLKFEGRIV